MDHPAPSFEAVIRPWRTATLVASAVAVLELLVIAAAGVALLGRTVSTQVQSKAEKWAFPAPAPKPTKAPVGAPKLARGETSVVVLNGNGRTGAAASAAEHVKARGYRVGSVGNAPRSDYGRSIVMYRRGYRAEGVRLARDLRIKLVGPLDGMRPRELLGAQLAYVVGA